jgi:hypothetical protein
MGIGNRRMQRAWAIVAGLVVLALVPLTGIANAYGPAMSSLN